MEGGAFKALVSDIAASGQRIPIVLHEGMILDGRNRYRACMEANVQPVTVAFTGGAPLAYVVSANLQRRHPDESQRGMVAVRLATLSDGQRSDRQGAPYPASPRPPAPGRRDGPLARDLATARCAVRRADRALKFGRADVAALQALVDEATGMLAEWRAEMLAATRSRTAAGR
jgi:hypothetical protein